MLRKNLGKQNKRNFIKLKKIKIKKSENFCYGLKKIKKNKKIIELGLYIQVCITWK
jgi:hypothetical protein